MVEVDPIILVAGTAAIAVLGVVACAQGRGQNKRNNNNDNNNDNNTESKQQQSNDNKSNKDESKTKKNKKEKKDNKTETSAPSAPVVQKQVVKEEVKQPVVVTPAAPAPTVTTTTTTTPTPAASSSKQTKQSKSKNVAQETIPAPVVTPPAPAPQAPPATTTTTTTTTTTQTTKAAGKSGKGNKVVETPVIPSAPVPVPAPAVQPVVSSKTQTKAAQVSTPAPAPPAPAPQVITPESTPVETDGTGDKKKKAKETPEQKAARLERQKKRKEEQAAAAAVEGIADNTPVVERVEYVTRVAVNDGWEVVAGKPKTKKTQANNSTTNATSTTTSSDATSNSVVNTSEQQSSKLTVDAKKIGIIIGPKGVTLRAIQDLTEATITMPKDRDTNATSASISISGTPDAVQNASNIIIELCTKGYSTRLEGENFQESHISVHNQYLSEIIGKNGASIRALQDKLSVRITIPQSNSKDANDTVKIGIAGDRENITRTKDIIREIMTYYHSPITHPGYVHASLSIPARFYNNIIGTKGGEIRHIQNNFKVTVHIPTSTTLNQSLLVVGENSHNVDNAVRYIQKIVQQVTTDEINNAVVAETWDEQTKLQNGDDNDNEWISQYMYNRNSDKTVDLMNALNVPISLPTAESNAWKIADSADGW